MAGLAAPYGADAQYLSRYEKDLLMQLYVLQAMDTRQTQSQVLDATIGDPTVPGSSGMDQQTGPWWQGMARYGGGGGSAQPGTPYRDPNKPNPQERMRMARQRAYQKKIDRTWLKTLRYSQNRPKAKKKSKTPLQVAKERHDAQLAEAMAQMKPQSYYRDVNTYGQAMSPGSGRLTSTDPYMALEPASRHYGTPIPSPFQRGTTNVNNPDPWGQRYMGRSHSWANQY